MKDDAICLLNDVKKALLGTAVMLAGLGFMGFSIVTHGDKSFWMAIILLIIGFVRVINASSAHGSADTLLPEPAQPEQTPDAPADEPTTPKED